jgi:hypothetical protein
MHKFLLFLLVSVSACSPTDDNEIARFNPTTGNAVNCRAFVQVVIDEYRKGTYTAEDSFSSLERNCGSNGYSWKNLREK